METLQNYIQESIDLLTLWYSFLYGEKRNGPSSDLDHGRYRDEYGNLKDDPDVALSNLLFTAYLAQDDDYNVYMHIEKPKKINGKWESNDKILISDEYGEYKKGFYKMQYIDGIDKINNKKPYTIAFRWDYGDRLSHTGRVAIIETILSVKEEKIYIIPNFGDTIGQKVATIDLNKIDIYKRLLRLELKRNNAQNKKLLQQSFKITMEKY